MPTWPLIGRNNELGLIADVLTGDKLAGVVLCGDAGVGKTRLARGALAEAEARGAATRWAVGTATAVDVPLGAVAHLVSVAQDGSMPNPVFLLHQAVDRLVTETGDRQLIVGIDDAHLLDPLSAMLVQQLALVGGVRLVLTLRSRQSVSDALLSLWKDEVLKRIEVSALSREQTSRLVEAVLAGPVESISLRRLWHATGGNPLFLRHLVEGELEAGHLRVVSGIWQWRGNLAVSSALAELVEARLSGLDPGARLALEHLAFGEPMGVGLLEELSSPGALEAAERRGLVTTYVCDQRLEARLAHPLYGDLLRSQAPPRRARQIRGELAEAVARRGTRREGDVLKVAVLLIDSDGRADPALLTRGAALALALLDVALAERLGRAAISAGAGFEARLAVAYATSWQGRPEEAVEDLERMVALAENNDERAQATIPWVASLFWSLKRPELAERVLSEAENTVNRCGPASPELQAVRSAFAFNLGRVREAVEIAEEILAFPEASAMARAWAAGTAACAWGRIGIADKVGEVATLGIRSVQRAPYASMVEYALAWGDVAGDLLAGRIEGAADKASKCQARSLETLLGAVTPIGALTMGVVAMARGRLVTALRWFREVVAALAGRDPAAWGGLGQMYAAQALGMAGEAEAAREALAETARARHPSLLVYQADELLAQAWVAAAEGALDQACSCARAAAQVAAGQGSAAVEVQAWHTLVRIGKAAEAAEAAEHLCELAVMVQGPMAQIAADHAEAVVERDGLSLDRVGSAFEAMGTDLLAADAFAHAATAHRHAGQRSSANAAGARVRALAERCERARTPAITAADLPLPISAREREVALLAARGLSNRQIAARLVVSVRTVESHLYQASSKLGVAGREGLLGVLGPACPERRALLTDPWEPNVS